MFTHGRHRYEILIEITLSLPLDSQLCLTGLIRIVFYASFDSCGDTPTYVPVIRSRSHELVPKFIRILFCFGFSSLFKRHVRLERPAYCI